MASKHVTLNVGGYQYLTMRSTLQRYPKTYFKKLFDGTEPQNENGHYLIDRDGKIFRHVLNFMRCGKLLLPTGFSEYDLLKCEAEFYSLTDLQNAIKERLKIGLKVGGEIIKITTDEAFKESDSFFTKMLSGQISVPRDAFGNYVIDRDADMFQYVLSYLKSGGILIKTEPKQLELLEKEGEFFGLQMLLHHIESIQFMQQEINKGSTTMYLHLFYHEKEECVIYANKDTTGSWYLPKSCNRYYKSHNEVFAGLIDEKQGFKPKKNTVLICKRHHLINYIHTQMCAGEFVPLKSHKLKDGWTQCKFSLPPSKKFGESS